MSLALYGTYYLNRLVEQIIPESRFFLDTFFTTETQSEDELIYFDKVSGERDGIAPFVHPLNEAPMIRSGGYETKAFKPAYIKEKTDLTADRGFHRLAGEAFGGELTPMQRSELHLARSVNRLYNRIRNRLELMAAEVVKTGKLTVRGDGLDAVLNFSRDPSLTKILTGEQSWMNPDLPMTSFFEGIQREIASFSLDQRRPTDVLVGVDALDMLRRNKEIREGNRTDLNGLDANIQMTPGVFSFKNVVYKGHYGNMRIWLHEGRSDDGRLFINPKEALFVCDDIRGVRHYGAIHDLKAGLRAQPIFAKSWEIEDPSIRFVMLQSAPVLISYDANTACLVKVAA